MQKFKHSLWFLILTLTTVQAQVSPLSKVFELIDELRKEIVADGEREDKAYQKLYDWCGRTSKDMHYEMETSSTAVSKLTAKVGKLEAEIEVAETEIAEQAAAVAKSEKELKDATAIRKKEAEEFAAAESELMATVDTLERALAQLEKQLSRGGSFAQIDESSLMNIVQTLSIVDNAAALSGDSMDALSALVQTHDDEGDPDAPSATAYQKQSGGIMEVLEDMKDKAEKQLSELRKNELGAKHSYELVKQGLQDEVKARNTEMQQEQSSKAANSEDKAAAVGDLEIATKAKALAKKKAEETARECQATASDHEANTAARAEEVKVIDQAEKILKESTGGGSDDDGGESGSTDDGDSFFQVSSSSISSSGQLVVRTVQDLAKQHHSASLAQLASRISAELRYSSAQHRADPFKKVKNLIVNMIGKLEKQAAEETTEKAYCDEEMAKTKAKYTELEEGVTKLSAKIGKAAAQSSALKQDVAELNNELSVIAKEQADLDAIRKTDHAAHMAAKKDLDAALGGVRKALSTLRDYYGRSSEPDAAAMVQEGDSDDSDDGDKMSSMMQQAIKQPSFPKKFQKSTGAGQGLIGILEVVESDLAKNLATEDAEETDAQSNYEEHTQTNAISKAEKLEDVKHKTQTFKSLDKVISELEADKTTLVAEFNAISDYFSKVKERCVAKPTSYDHRKARRDAEIQGLKEALSSLESMALAQIRKHRRLRSSLRGEALQTV